MTRHFATGLAAAFAILLTLVAQPASAGVATSGAVLLDPYDPVPEIQFHHFGGYGCIEGCGYSDCGGYCGRTASYDGCDDGCRPRHRRHWRCDDDCGRSSCRDNCGHDDCRDRCDRGCEHDCNTRCDHDCGGGDCGGGDCRTAAAPPCQSERCYNDEHYERRWRDGNHVGQEWMDRGTRERTLQDDHGSAGGYYRSGPSWNDDDDPPPPPPPPPPQDDHDHHHH